MTVFCKPIGWLSFGELFRGRLQAYGVYERLVDKKSTDPWRSLTDGCNAVWVCGEGDSGVTQITLKGCNNPEAIFDAVLKEFGVRIVSQRDPEFWGFKTLEELGQARSREENESFYRELRKYLDGKPNEIESGAEAYSQLGGAPSVTVDLIKAQIAKQIVADDPTLLQPVKKGELITQMLARVSDIRRAFAWDDEDNRYAHLYYPSPNGRLEAKEDAEEGPLPAGAYIFEIDQRGLIVARERAGFREAAAARQRDNDHPF